MHEWNCHLCSGNWTEAGADATLWEQVRHHLAVFHPEEEVLKKGDDGIKVFTNREIGVTIYQFPVVQPSLPAPIPSKLPAISIPVIV